MFPSKSIKYCLLRSFFGEAEALKNQNQKYYKTRSIYNWDEKLVIYIDSKEHTIFEYICRHT